MEVLQNIFYIAIFALSAIGAIFFGLKLLLRLVLFLLCVYGLWFSGKQLGFFEELKRYQPEVKIRQFFERPVTQERLP